MFLGLLGSTFRANWTPIVIRTPRTTAWYGPDTDGSYNFDPPNEDR